MSLEKYASLVKEPTHEHKFDGRLNNQLGFLLSAKDFLPKKDLDFLNGFFKDFIGSRNKRAEDISREDYTNFVKEIEQLFPYPIFTLDCIDGRVLSVLLGGYVAKFGGTLRIPAGDPMEFIDYDKQSAKLAPNSNFAERLDEAFARRSDSNKINQILDSHIGCAAKNKEEKEKRGLKPTDPDIPDHGLLEDVKRKKRIAQGMINYVENQFGNEKEILPIQLSFDVNNGFIYMGLETPKALAAAEKRGGFFDHSKEAIHKKQTFDVLEELTNNDDIISTKKLSKDPIIKSFCEQLSFTPNWESDYLKTTYEFWTNIDKLSKNRTVTSIIKGRLIKVFGKELEKRPEELKQRIMILLVNTYSGYHLNRKDYKYKKHREECIVVSEGGYSPFDINSFGVHILDKDNLTKRIKLAYRLVSDNKKTIDRIHIPGDPIDTHRIINTYGLSRKDFQKTPIPLMIQHMVRFQNNEDREKFFDLLKKLKLENIAGDTWLNLDEDKFVGFLKKEVYELSKPKYKKVVKEILKLREYMKIIYDDPEVGYLLKNNKMIALPAMIDQDRKIQAIFPLIAN